MAVDEEQIGSSEDHATLEALGYETKFRREMGLWETFALGFTYLSPVVGVYSLFAFALATGGPPMIWAIVIAMAGQLLVALVFGEVVSQLPVAGGIYPWTKHLWGRKWAWLAAWIYMWALMVTLAAIAYGAGPFIAQLFGFTPTKETTVICALIVVGIVTLLNFGGTKVLSTAAFIGFAAEITGVIVVGAWLLIAHTNHGIGVIVDNFNIAGDASYFPAFTAAALIGIYLFYGFEACGDVAEEVVDPSRKIPRAMRMTVYIGGAAALFITLALLLSVPSYEAIFSGANAAPITNLFLAVFGPVGFKVVLIVVLISFFSCSLSLQAAASRLVYSYARDNMLPGSRVLSIFSDSRGVPPCALLLAAIIPALVILASEISPNALTTIISFGALGIYLAFMSVTIASLRAKLVGWKPSGKFTLGLFGIPVTVVAIAYQILAELEMVWPRSPGAPWYVNYLVLISTSIVVGIGIIYLFVARPYKKLTHRTMATYVR